MGGLENLNSNIQFMKQEFIMLSLSFMMIELGKNTVAIFALIAAIWGIVNRYYETKRNIDLNHNGSFKKYIKSLRFRKRKKTNKNDDK